MTNQSIQTSVEQAYATLHSNGAINTLIYITQGLAIIIMVSKLISIFQKGHEKPDFSVQIYFKMLQQYILFAAFIAVFPHLLNFIEHVLGSMQDNLTMKYSGSLNTNVESSQKKMLETYMDNLDKVGEDKGGVSGALLEALNTLIMPIVLGIFTIGLYILKYTYFMFMAGRYLWLLMLEVVAPFAIMSFLSPATKSYFNAWIKNMILCYLMIPFLLLADIFSEMLIKIVFTEGTIEDIGFMSVIFMVVLKLTMYKVATTKLYHLM